MAQAKLVKFHPSRTALRAGQGGYNFIDKDPLVDQLAEWVRTSGLSYKVIAERAGIGHSTVQRLFTGRTVRPQQHTVVKLGKVFGRRLGWQVAGAGEALR